LQTDISKRLLLYNINRAFVHSLLRKEWAAADGNTHTHCDHFQLGETKNDNFHYEPSISGYPCLYYKSSSL